MAASDHLSGPQFYHATNHEFEPGKTLTPEGARSSHVYYSDNLGIASRHGTNVYRVTPETPDKDRRRAFTPYADELMTRSSLRVEGKLSPDEVSRGNAEYERTRANWRAQNGGE